LVDAAVDRAGLEPEAVRARLLTGGDRAVGVERRAEAGRLGLADEWLLVRAGEDRAGDRVVDHGQAIVVRRDRVAAECEPVEQPRLAATRLDAPVHAHGR